MNWLGFHKSGTNGNRDFSLRFRLLFFLALFLLVNVTGLALILFSTGVFSAGRAECRAALANELTHVSRDIEREFGTLSVEGVVLSQKLSKTIEDAMPGRGPVAGLAEHPEWTEPALRACLDTLITAIEKNTVSGAFLVLDATVNPSAPGAEDSRAGVYIRNMEPNALNRSAASLHYLRGPMKLARERGLWVLPQWRMEFTAEAWFCNTLDEPWDGGELSRHYRWNPRAVLAGDYEDAMLLTLPLVSSDGRVFGVCGLEVNATLFKLQNEPDNSVHRRVFSVLTPVEDGVLDMGKAMCAGNFGSRIGINGPVTAVPGRDGIERFTTEDGAGYAGLWQEINLYPKGAVYGVQRWATVVMMPEQDLQAYSAEKNTPILILLACLLAAAVSAAVYISKRYLSPVYKAFEDIKTREPSGRRTSHIKEIVDLFTYLAERDALAAREAEAAPLPAAAADSASQAVAAFSSRYDQFLKALETLSKAQRKVFDLYVQNHTAAEIAEILNLTMATIKSHNRNIYVKLGVKSIRELMVYVNMMKGGTSDDA